MSTTDTKDEKGYKETLPWAGKPRWACTDDGCAFDTLVEAKAAEHAATAHRPVGTARVSPIVGPDGQPIVVVGEPVEHVEPNPELVLLQEEGLAGITAEDLQALHQAAEDEAKPKASATKPSGPGRQTKEA